MLRSIPDSNKDKYCGLTWFEMDTLRGGHDTQECYEFIAVTDGQPGSTIRAAYNFARPRKSVQRLIDDGYLTFVKHETYPRGAQCDVYKLSGKGRKIVRAYYEGFDDLRTTAREAAQERRADEYQQTRRAMLIQALEDQYQGNYYAPALYEQITDSQTPFLDVPLPTLGLKMDGTPITIREYLFTLWFAVLPDDAHKMITDFFMWSDVLGEDNALEMFNDQRDGDEPPTSPYGNINWKDDDETDE